MKKIFSILMIFILIFTMTGCNKSEETVVETDSIINKIETTAEEVNIIVEGDFLETDSLSAEKVIEEENILGLDISLDSNVENDEYTVSIENVTTNEDTEVYVVENNNQVRKEEAEVEDNKVNYNHSTVTPVIIDNTSTPVNNTTPENNTTTVEEVAQKIEETKTENKTEQKTENKTVTWSDWKKTDEKVTKEATTTTTGTKVITYTRTSSDGQTQTKTETQTIAKIATSTPVNNSSNSNTSSGNTNSGSTVNNNNSNNNSNSSSSNTKPAHTHSYGSWKNNSSQHWKECSCGDISNRSNHTFGSWTTTKQATTTEAGKKERSCTTCGYKETETIPKVTSSGNNNSGSNNNNNNSGNNNNNNTSHSHSYGSWTVKTAATCTNSGTEVRKCSCGKEETRTISAKGHSWMFSRTVEPTTTSEGYDLYLCTECGKQEKRNIKAKVEVHSHSYGAWQLSGDVQYRVCSCGDRQTKEAGKRWVVDVPAQEAVYEERQVQNTRQAWWVTYSQFKDNERQWSNPSYHTTLTFYTQSEWESSTNYWKSLNQYVGHGMYPEVYYTTETVLVKPAVEEQGHWEYYIIP